MKVLQVLHMNEGEGEASYAQNSLIPKRVLTMTKPIKEEAIATMNKLFPNTRCLAIADLGCSSGPNTFWAIGELITTIYNLRSEFCKADQEPVSIEVFLNDLPGNDFNSVFRALPEFKKQLKQEIGERFHHCFFHGVPGSFYDRLFQPESLHFVHSSYSLHFLSQVPNDLGRSNKSNIYLSSESPESVVKAYYHQFQTDFSTFLSYRSEELVNGGCMVFTLLGRSDDPSIKGSGYIWEPLASVLHQMVTEGIIEEEMLDVFNLPFYTPSPTEIEMEVKKEGSYELKCLQVLEVDWEVAGYAGGESTAAHVGLVKCMRAVAESMLSDHFGQDLMDQVFTRYGLALADCMAKERTFLTNITVSLIKIG